MTGEGDEVLGDAFAPLKFSGGRYNDPGYPLETLNELATYQKLLIEIARSVWLEANPTKKNVPSTVAKDLQLRLTVVEKGSVIPMTLPATPEAIDLIDSSRDRIRSIFEFIVEKKHLPIGLTDRARDLLQKMGKSLAPDETLHVKARHKEAVCYTAAIRDEMTTNEIAGEVLFDGWLPGRVIGFTPDKQTFEARLANGRTVPARFESADFWRELSPFVAPTRAANIVRFQARYAETLTGDIIRIDDVTAVEEFIRSGEPWSQRLEQLLMLRAGWLDGGGAPVEMLTIQYADRIMTLLADRVGDLEPRLFPTPEGGVQIEVDSGHKRIEVAISPDMDVEGYGLDTESDEEEERSLSSPEEAAEFLSGWSLV